jgi:hypothetical protein
MRSAAASRLEATGDSTVDILVWQASRTTVNVSTHTAANVSRSQLQTSEAGSYSRVHLEE